MGDIGKTDCPICKFFKYRKDFACSMDLKELNYIVVIADEGSISRAADKLYMAQSSLSQFLFQYEAELGAKLFVRTARGVRPTSAGEVFIDHARQILMDYHRTKNEIWDIEQLHGGRIDLGISTFRGTRLSAPRPERIPAHLPRHSRKDHGTGQRCVGKSDYRRHVGYRYDRPSCHSPEEQFRLSYDR